MKENYPKIIVLETLTPTEILYEMVFQNDSIAWKTNGETKIIKGSDILGIHGIVRLNISNRNDFYYIAEKKKTNDSQRNQFLYFDGLDKPLINTVLNFKLF